jgi:aminopeptidase N
MLIGTVTPLEIFKAYVAAIKVEKNELITNYLSGRIQSIFWNFLTEAQQNNVQRQTENEIWSSLEKEVPKNIKKTLFSLYTSMAISEQGKDNLYEIWKGEKKIKNLYLNEDDFTSLAIKLAIFEHVNAPKILEVQQTRISNKDRIERFRWLLPSVSADERTRDAFMASLLQKENREKESWVQNALNNIHHPLRQKSARKHLLPILETLQEVQLTGDIFFPKGWLASSIGNYSSKEAFEILNQFLENHPNYNPILLKKLMQTTDNLTRAQNIKK